MGFIQKIINGINERRLKKLKKDLISLRNEINFDPFAFTFNLGHDNTLAFTRRITEYKVWSMGDAGVLSKFYRESNGGFEAHELNKINYFWKSAPASRRRVHCGVPALLSARMADILFKNGIQLDVDVFKDGDGDNLAEDKAAEKKANEFVNYFAGKLRLQEIAQTGAVFESWGGHVFFRLSHDSKTSAFPILEVFDITRCERISDRGITKAIVFKSYYEHNNKKYRLDEIYTTTEEDDAAIVYKLYKYDGGKVFEVDLTAIPQTEALFNINGENPDGITLEEFEGGRRFVYRGLKGMLAFDKPNKIPSKEFPESGYGASDYEGSVDEFDALDEITSENVREIRTNATVRYVPKNMLVRDQNGEVIGLNQFADCYETVAADDDQDARQKIEVEQVSDKTASFLEKWKVCLSTVCNNAKLSPYSLGITWLEAVGPSSDSLAARNKVTTDMRESKLRLWKATIEEIIGQALQLTAWIRENVNGANDRLKEVPEIDFTSDKTAVHASFGDYVGETLQERVNVWSAAKGARVASTEEALRNIHPEWTEKQITDEANVIRYEEGMGVDNPASLPELKYTDEE